MTLSELKFHAKKGNIDDKMFKTFIEEGLFKRDQLLQEGILTEEDLSRIFRISREEHLKNIQQDKYSIDQMRELAARGEIQRDDLVENLKSRIRKKGISNEEIIKSISLNELEPNNLIKESVLTQADLDEIYDRPLPPIDVGFHSWDDIPELVPDRVDVFVLGVPGSGKSAFMAGFLYYARKNGLLRQDSNHTSGLEYTLNLTTAVKNGRLPPATIVENMQYMACDLRNEKGGWLPMTFIEMSGEIFRLCFGKATNEMPEKLMSYLQHDNSKLLILAIDYQAETSVYSNSHVGQGDYHEFMVPMLKKIGTFQNTRAIIVLITKWDLSPDQSDKAARNFLESRYKNLVKSCVDLESDFGVDFQIFTFSLGKFKRRNSYDFDEKPSREIYEWMTDTMPEQTNHRKKRFPSWLDLFRKKNK